MAECLPAALVRTDARETPLYASQKTETRRFRAQSIPGTVAGNAQDAEMSTAVFLPSTPPISLEQEPGLRSPFPPACKTDGLSGRDPHPLTPFNDIFEETTR